MLYNLVFRKLNKDTNNILIRKVPTKKGFTLLELLVVVGILAALVALALPYYQDYVNQSKLTAAAADLNTFRKALAMYDQLEPSMFTTNATYDNFTALIGKYMQDFRKTSTQIAPTDPWSSDYHVFPAAGSIVSGGPDGTITTVATAREPAGDDILVTWKPQFFVSSAKKINPTTIELIFTRKLLATSVAAGDISATGYTASTFNKISDTIYRFKSTTAITGGTVTVTDTAITAQDGKAIYAAENKPDGTACNVAPIN